VAAIRYNELLSPCPGIVTPLEADASRSVYHLYVIRTKDRDELAEHLKRSLIQTGLHYPLPVHLQECYREWGYREGSLPVSERVAAENLSLPMFPGLTANQQERVKAGIEAFFGVATQK
jgi:dTDP-4-amino-4,6-dideoxygalactose transaminase